MPLVHQDGIISQRVISDLRKDFLQHHTLPNKRVPQGLQYIFDNTFPIYDFNGDSYLEFVEYNIGYTKYTIEEC